MKSCNNTNRRIWVISELYYPENTSTGYILTKISEGMASHFEVCVLCCRPTYSQKGVNVTKSEKRNGVLIRRCFSTTFNKNNIVKRLINGLTFCLSVFIHLLFRIKSDDKVLIVTNPPMLVLFVSLVCRFKKASLVLLVHDIYPDVLVVAKLFKAKSLVVRLWHFINAYVMKKCSTIIVIGRDMKKKLVADFDILEEKIVFIPNFADIDVIHPQDHNGNSFLGRFALQSKLVIQNAGNIGPLHDINLILNAAKLLQNILPDIVFMFIGSGKKKVYLEKMICDENLLNVVSLPQQPREMSNEFMNACDITLSVFVEGMKGVSVPSRSYNIMASGKPFLAVTDPESELGLMIKEEQIGWVVTPGDLDGFIDACTDIWNHKDQLITMGRQSRKAAEEKYSLETVVKLFVDCLKL